MKPEKFEEIVSQIPQETKQLYLTLGLISNRVSTLMKSHNIEEKELCEKANIGVYEFNHLMVGIDVSFETIAKLEVFFNEKIITVIK